MLRLLHEAIYRKLMREFGLRPPVPVIQPAGLGGLVVVAGHPAGPPPALGAGRPGGWRW